MGNLTIAVKFCPRHSGKGQILHSREDLAIQILFYPGAENKQMSKVCPEAGGKGDVEALISDRSQIIVSLWHRRQIVQRKVYVNASVSILFYFQLNYQDRVIGYQAKGRVRGFQWLYDGTAWDVESGISVTDKHYQSKQGAIEHTVKKLIDALKAKGLVS